MTISIKQLTYQLEKRPLLLDKDFSETWLMFVIAFIRGGSFYYHSTESILKSCCAFFSFPVSFFQQERAHGAYTAKLLHLRWCTFSKYCLPASRQTYRHTVLRGLCYYNQYSIEGEFCNKVEILSRFHSSSWTPLASFFTWPKKKFGTHQ